MKQITLAEYNALHPDRRGIWTTERDDLPNWSRDRHLFIGKRTMMAGDGKCTLLIEGLSFEIVDEVTDPYLYLREIRVVFSDPSDNITTQINGTRTEIVRYYDRPVSLGIGDTDERFAHPIAIEFLCDDPTKTIRVNYEENHDHNN